MTDFIIISSSCAVFIWVWKQFWRTYLPQCFLARTLHVFQMHFSHLILKLEKWGIKWRLQLLLMNFWYYYLQKSVHIHIWAQACQNRETHFSSISKLYFSTSISKVRLTMTACWRACLSNVFAIPWIGRPFLSTTIIYEEMLS